MSHLPIAFATPAPVPGVQLNSSRTRSRIVLIASSDASLRERLRQSLTGLRWQVLEAPGGAEAWVASQAVSQLEALLIDPWLPDLEVAEFLRDFHQEHPQVDLMMTDGAAVEDSVRSAYHQELLYALRRSQDSDTAAWQMAPQLEPASDPARLSAVGATQILNAPDHAANRATDRLKMPALPASASAGELHITSGSRLSTSQENRFEPGSGSSGMPPRRDVAAVERIPELVGSSPVMLEVSRRIRLVAAKSTPVLIEGPTGSGKELVAEALHRLSTRSRKPFVAINCAAIPEALLEAELFGHTRGAFTGAVQGRTGRIESADGGTLFLDEIGEMPLSLQSKLLRFFESGELQRIGDNEIVKVDVRLVAATHQPLAEHAQKGLFRADLYYRLAVFLIRTPALIEHLEDLPQLVSHFLERMGRKSPVKRIDSAAMSRLSVHGWQGNIRELEHVLERAAILAGEEPVISAQEIDFGLSPVN
ncbi:MAG TPA: sigma-54 dependent transcriptional regulator [Acidobacteriaceae bacterium]|jgi:DNA-binding NtrC family response regulator|nr:sigma-54 dependent transcriptional regulator [Acidobacteriaceae bacterium]